MGKGVFLWENGSFLRRRRISMEEGFFYRGGVFLQWRLIFTAEAYLYSGKEFLQRRLINFYGRGVFLQR